MNMTMKLICKINERISIWADEHQYVVRIQTNPNQKIKHADSSYFSTLEACFDEIFDHLCRSRLADGQDKDLKEIAKIILMTKKEIMEIMRPFTELKTDLKGRQEVAEVGK